MPPETTPATAENTTVSQAASEPATTTALTDAEGSATQQAASDVQAETKPESNTAQVAPETYEFKAPEGREFSPEVLANFSEVAKELNLSQDNAQKVLDKIGPALAEGQTRAISDARNAWVESSKADKEFGGDKLNENLSVAKKALEAFGSPELSTLLKDSGLGDHPEIIRMLFRAGKAISEDSRLVSGKSGNPAADVAKRLFPNQN